MRQKTPEIDVPKHLRPATAAWFAEVCREYELEPHHRRLLTLAAESWDRCQQARETLDEKGLIYGDRFGSPRSRPEVAIEKDSRIAFCRCLRELGLDLAEPPEAPRAPAATTGKRCKGGL